MNSPEVSNAASPKLPKTSKAPRRSSTSTSSRRERDSASTTESSSKAPPPKKYQASGHKEPKSPSKLPPVTRSSHDKSKSSDRRSSRDSSREPGSGHTKAVRRNSSAPKATPIEPSNSSDVFGGTDSMLSTGHTKAVRRMSSSARQVSSNPPNAPDLSKRLLSQNSRDTKTIRPSESTASGDTESPTDSPSTPTTPKEYPMSSGTEAKFAREVKVLTETVQALANKLKRRDKEVQKLNAAATRHAEVSQLLENTEERLLDAKMENQSMAIVVKDLKSSLEKQGAMQDNERTPSVSSNSNSEKKMVDPEEHRKVRSERDSAMTKAGAMAMTLAECRAETDELKDQLAAVREQLEQANNPDAPASPSNANYPPTTGVCPPTTRSSMAKSLSLRNLMMPMTPGGNLNKKMGAMWGNRSTHGPK